MPSSAWNGRLRPRAPAGEPGCLPRGRETWGWATVSFPLPTPPQARRRRQGHGRGWPWLCGPLPSRGALQMSPPGAVTARGACLETPRERATRNCVPCSKDPRRTGPLWVGEGGDEAPEQAALIPSWQMSLSHCCSQLVLALAVDICTNPELGLCLAFLKKKVLRLPTASGQGSAWGLWRT